MRALVVAGLAALSITAANLAFGQQPPPPGAAPPPPGAAAPPAAVVPQGRSPAAQSRRIACRQDGQSKGMRGPELTNYVAVCVEEARLACTKQAAAQNLRGPQRKDFMQRCLAS